MRRVRLAEFALQHSAIEVLEGIHGSGIVEKLRIDGRDEGVKSRKTGNQPIFANHCLRIAKKPNFSKEQTNFSAIKQPVPDSHQFSRNEMLP